jgi:glutamine amidotransferase
MIAVVNTGTNNMASVLWALGRIGLTDLELATDARTINDAEALVLPGVGAFGDTMTRLKALGIVETLRNAALSDRKPLLGICLGMQILADRSAESENAKGLGLIPGRFERLDNAQTGQRIPNIGWRKIAVASGAPALFQVLDGGAAYFAHSYVYVGDDANVAAWTEFDGKKIPCALWSEGIGGVQFHPEKSQDDGLDFLFEYFRTILPGKLRRPGAV